MRNRLITFLILALLLSGCRMRVGSRLLNGGNRSSVDALTPVATQTEDVFPTPEPSTATPSPSLTPTVSLSPTPQPVTITALKGNIFIRRGPDAAFNAVGVLMKGQSEPAQARDVLGNWVKIPLPANSDLSGWVSLLTTYTTVQGDVHTLPEMNPTDWPVLATLRNCTSDEMVTEPGGIIIPSADNFPANEVPIDPGIYRIYDNVVDGYPEVLKVELREGSAIDIIVNGNGEKHKCSAP